MNQSCLRCGHPAQVYVTIPKGQGRIVCPSCDWNDGNPPQGTGEAQPSLRRFGAASVEVLGGPQRRGVQVVSKN